MLIEKLMPEHFGNLHKTELELSSGINVIFGENGTGKSTLHGFIRGMLFGIERARGRAAKEDPYVRYQPWDTKGAYQGSMVIEQDGISYLIRRTFYLKERSLEVTRLDTGRKLDLKEGSAAELVPNLTESNFKNTVSVEQLHAKTDTELAQEVQNYIANLSTSKSSEVDVANALSRLNTQRKKMETAPCFARNEELERLVAEEQLRSDQMNQLDAKKEELLPKQNKLRAEQDKTEFEAKQTELQLEVVTELGSLIRLSQEKVSYIRALKEKQMQTEAALAEVSTIQESLGQFREELEQADQIEHEIESKCWEQGHLQEEEEASEERSNQERQKQKNFTAGLLAVAVIFLTVGIVTDGVLRLILFLACICSVAFGLLSAAKRSAAKQYAEKNTKKLEQKRRKLEEEILVKKEIVEQIYSRRSAGNRQELRLQYEAFAERGAQAVYLRNRVSEVELELTKAEEENQKQSKVLVARLSGLFSEEELSSTGIKSFCTKLEGIRELISAKHRDLLWKKNDLERKREELVKQQQEFLLDSERLQWELSSYEENEEALMEHMAELKEVKQTVFEAEQEVSALKLATDVLGSLSADIHDSFGQELNKMVSRLTEQVTNGAYKTVTIDEKMEIQVMHDNTFVPLPKLSAGTIEQIYLAFRLSVAELFFENNPMTIILDDGLALYDDRRAEAVLSMLSGLDRQIILFTCQHREEMLLGKLGIPFHFISLGAK